MITSNSKSPVGLILLGHEEETDAVEELDAVEGRHAHVEEDTVEHCRGQKKEVRILSHLRSNHPVIPSKRFVLGFDN